MSFHLERSAALGQREPPFHELVAEHLRRAPWLVLSLALHAIVVMVLMLLPAATVTTFEPSIAMAPPAAVPPEIEPPPPPLETPILEPVHDPQFVDPVVDPRPDTTAMAPDDVPLHATIFSDLPLADTAIGLTGGGGPLGSGRGVRRGGNSLPKQVIESVDAALRWLARHQDEDGRWDADEFMKHDAHGLACDGAGNGLHDVGVTGLALLAFLGDGNTMSYGPYAHVVKRAVLWLREQQQHNGLFGTDSNQHFVYDHAVAALAMCEAYGLSGHRLLRTNAQRGIDYLEQHRNPYGMWRYAFQGGDADLSVSGWAIMAYVSADHFGIDVNRTVFERAAAYIDELTDPTTGRVGYDARGSRSSRHPGLHGMQFPADKSEAMTGTALLCRTFLGQKPTRVVELGADLVLQRKPVWKHDGSIDMYHWYYGTYALYQLGGARWKEWQLAMNDAVIGRQRRDGNFTGSWDPAGAWGAEGGRVYSTALLALTLEAYYRYARVLGGR